jgi:hypothetical protein
MWTPGMTTLALAALLAPLFTAMPAAAAAAAADLPAPTSTTAVSVTHQQRIPPQPVVTAIRLGRHAVYDRVVYDIRGSMPSYSARYVRAVANEGGQRVPIRGAAVLVVSLHSVDSTHPPAAPGPTALPAIRDIEGFDGYGGYLNYGIGVSDRNGFRILELQHPTRLVIDIAHDLPAPTSTALQASVLGDDRNASLVGIRAGAHPAYDRAVFDFGGPNTGLRYVVGYLGGQLRVDLEHGTVRDASGVLTYRGPWMLHPALAQLKTIRITRTSVDGTTVLLTPGHPAGFRAFLLRSPDRIVVDIAH